MKLDAKDRKILNLLDSDARMPATHIAKKIGVSPEVAHYRLKKLDEKIITQYQIIVNLSALGIIQFKICMALEKITSEQLIQIIAQLKKKIQVKWIVTCKGKWDIIIAFESNNIKNADAIKNEILELFGETIREKAIAMLIEAQTFNRDYLTQERSPLRNARTIMSQQDIIKIDEIDRDIIKLLAENARMNIVEIAARLRIDPRVVIYHIKKMEKNKVILGYKIAVNYDELGARFYKLFIFIRDMNKDRFISLINYLKMHKNCIHHVKVLGNWDLEPEFETASEKEFDEITKDIKDRYSDIIGRIDIITISQEHKFVYF